MRRAMMERILVIGTSSPGRGAGAAALATAAGAVAGVSGWAGAAGFAAAGLADGFSRWLRMSDLVMRPAEPVPGTWLRSTLLSLAILRTSGDERSRSPDAAEAASAAGAATADAAAAGAGAAAAGPAALGAAAAPAGLTPPQT